MSRYQNRTLTANQLSSSALQNQQVMPIIDNLVIYQDKALLTIKVVNAGAIQLLPGFIPDSVTFVADNGNSLNFSMNQMYDSRLLTTGRNYVELTDMNDKVITGILSDLGNDHATIITDEGRVVIVRKWKQMITKNGVKYNTENLFNATEPGTLRYMISGISWVPMFNFYVSENNQGILHLNALIQNITNAKIMVNNVVLVYGNNIIQESGRATPYASNKMAMALPMASYQSSDVSGSSQNIVTELLTYNLGKFSIDIGDTNKPIYMNAITYNDLYIINFDYGGSDRTAINADYGYKIPNGNQDLPGGLMKIFTTSSNSTLLLGSVNVDRTPQNSPLEIIIGKTTRVRAMVYKAVDSRETKVSGTSRKINVVTINGTLINDTGKNQIVSFRDMNYSNDKITDCVPQCNKKRNYLEWVFNVKPGSSNVNIQYTMNPQYL